MGEAMTDFEGMLPCEPSQQFKFIEGPFKGLTARVVARNYYTREIKLRFYNDHEEVVDTQDAFNWGKANA